MTNRNAEAPQMEVGNDAAVPPASQPPPQSQTQGQPQAQPSAQGGNDNNPFSRANNKVYKSGPLFLSSKGIGWTSWKKRWFVLTRTSLVFYRSDPNAVPQKGSEVNLTLGGIDLNSSGSVVVKEDKKLLTVLFPDGRDGRDGRAFTLKAETSEDLHEWKAALEEALASAPNPALVMGQNGILRNDQSNPADTSAEQAKDRQPVKSLVVGRPILLALEDIDGTPSFLEKSLKFVEDHGITVEGILRQAADVEDVERRIREYEQGKNEFSPDEDAHVIADCVKYILRELPSSPVPASCCKALLEAYRTDRSNRVNAMRVAICETFPEPNRILLQRILVMMQSVAAHKNETRMSVSAVAACMAPLLLRPLLAGDCELEHGFDIGGDNSLQLMQAAAAANHAQAICITLLEEYNSLFGEGSASPEPYTDDEDDSGSETEELTDDDDESNEDDDDDESNEDDYSTEGSEADVEEDNDQLSSATGSDNDETADNKVSESSSSVSNCPEIEEIYDEPIVKSSPKPPKSSSRELSIQSDNDDKVNTCYSVSGPLPSDYAETPVIAKSSITSNGPGHRGHRTSPWGRAHARKNLSMESIDLSLENETEIEKLEAAKADLQNRIANEAKGNALLQSSLEERKNALYEQRLALEREVRRLQEQLQKEKDLRAALEAGLKSQGQGAASSTIGEKMKAEIEEIAQAESEVNSLKQKADDLGQQLNQQREQNSELQLDKSNHPSSNAKPKKERQKSSDTSSTKYVRERSSRNKHEFFFEKPDRDKATQKHDSSSEKPKSSEKPEKPKSSEKPEKPKSSEKPRSSAKQSDREKGKKQESTDDISYSNQQQATSEEQAVVKPASNSKKSSSRSEGINATTSALSKLTNRLNFLKERRTQMESQTTTDKSHSSGQSSQNQEKGQSSDNKGPDSQQQSDRGRRNDNHPNLDQGKSESFPPGEKGWSYTPRTNSR